MAQSAHTVQNNNFIQYFYIWQKRFLELHKLFGINQYCIEISSLIMESTALSRGFCFNNRHVLSAKTLEHFDLPFYCPTLQVPDYLNLEFSNKLKVCYLPLVDE